MYKLIAIFLLLFSAFCAIANASCQSQPINHYTVFLSVSGSSSCRSINTGSCAQYGSYDLCTSTPSCGQGCSENYYYSGYYYVGVTEWQHCQSSSCYVNSNSKYCHYTTRCTTQLEADSLVCVNKGYLWQNDSCVTPCDPSKYTCNTTSELITEETSSDQITCIGGTCYGVKGCKYYSKYTTTCVNECNTDVAEESYSTNPIFIDGACDDKDLEGECTNTICTELTPSESGANDGKNRYIIYQNCYTNNMTNGQLEMIPKIQKAGIGSCASQGFPNTPPPSSDSSSTSSGSSSPTDSIPADCLLFGACSSYSSDTTDYSNPFNRNSSNGCTCDDDQGTSNIIRITCPDGSISYDIGSCDGWNNKHSSSSSPPPSSSSSATDDGGESSDSSGDWATSDQAEDIEDSLGAINGTLKAIASLISAINPMWSESESGELTPAMIEAVFGQGEYSAIDSTAIGNVTTWVDSMVIDSSGGSAVLDSVFGLMPTENTLIDTLGFSHSSKCPVFIVPIKVASFDREVVIDCGDIGDFDLCTISSTLMMIFASWIIIMLQIRLVARAIAS